jgi:hypothetical protein
MRAHHSKFTAFVALGLTAFAVVVRAQDPLVAVKPYDGIQAGLDAYRLAEEKRQGAVNGQIAVNDQMRYWNGYPTSRGETIYYGYLSPAAASFYGYSMSPYGPYAGFQPWPWTGGGLWGTPAYYQPARQPIGQQQIQIGPNHWESHPVYDPPLTMYRPQPPVDSPLLDRTPYASPAPGFTTTIVTPPASLPNAAASEPVPPPPPVPAAPTRRGPREY